MEKEIKTREQIPVEDTWDLGAIYSSMDKFEADLKKITELTDEIAAMKGRLCENGQNLYKYYTTNERVNELFDTTFNYVQRLADADTKNSENQALRMRLGNFATGIAEKGSFVEPELQAGLSTKLDQLYAECDKLHEFDVSIKETLRSVKHTLSPEMEELLASAGEVLSGPSSVFSMFDNADVVFPEITDENGEKIRITHGRYRMLLENPNVNVRRDMFMGYYSMYEAYKNTLAANYQNLVKSHIFTAKARKYSSSLEAATDANNVPTSVYRNLIDVVNKNMDKMYRYMGIRKRVLGFEEQHMYDLFVPLVQDVDKKIPFEEAEQMVLDALEPMGKDYTDVVKRAFKERWIDKYENAGKRSGAYSAGVYGVHPYILMNYDGGLDSVFTLIHEMGHTMHSYYSSQAQSCTNSYYKIFVAEVASTCNESLLTQSLLKKTTDKKERAYIINHMLDDFRTTLYRQTMFAEFELATHEAAERGESLTADKLCSMYYELNHKYYGDNVVNDPQIAYEWARIPHFFYNFYVYQYATGYSAALALSKRILTEGESAVADYKKFLSGGCTMSPTDLLKVAGVDMTSPEPIEQALQVFSDYMDEIEKLI